MSPTQKAKAAGFDPIEVANAAKANPYIQSLISDASLRENLQKALESTRSAYGRMTNGKTPSKALIEDKKLQRDLRHAGEALREATITLREAPKKQARKGRRWGRALVVLGLGAGISLIASEKLRSKVLDTLFGAEEEFEYTPPPGTPSTPPTAPVSAA